MATNVKYLKENNLYEAHKHFMRLSEAYIPTILPEEEMGDDGENNMQDPNAMADGASPQDLGQMGDNGMPQNSNAMGGDAVPQNDVPMGDASEGGGMDMMGANEPMASPEMPPMDMQDEGGEDEVDGDVIDIDDLTKAQEKINVKQNHIGRDLSKVDNRINTLIDTISTLLNKVETNNSEIESLKAEFEKRNPTQTEKLNLRSLDSYPFNVKPNEYWSEKAKEGGYEAYGDNDEPTTKEYVITNDDVDNPSKDIANTFFDINDDDIQTLEKIFKL